VWCGVVWCGVVWCGVVWCGVVWCGVVWCGVVWWCVHVCACVQHKEQREKERDSKKERLCGSVISHEVTHKHLDEDVRVGAWCVSRCVFGLCVCVVWCGGVCMCIRVCVFFTGPRGS